MNTSVLPHQTMTSRSRLVFLLEPTDVVDQRVGQDFLVGALLDVRSFQALHIPLIEDRRPRANLFELGTDLFEQRRLDDARRARRGVRVVFEDVPGAKDEIVERRERQDVADLRRAALGPLAQAHRAHLRERSDWLGETFADRKHAGNGRCADCAQTDEQDPQLALSRGNFDGNRHEGTNYIIWSLAP